MVREGGRIPGSGCIPLIDGLFGAFCRFHIVGRHPFIRIQIFSGMSEVEGSRFACVDIEGYIFQVLHVSRKIHLDFLVGSVAGVTEWKSVALVFCASAIITWAIDLLGNFGF